MSWKDGLLEVALAMNSQVHSATGSSPLKVLFRQHIVTSDWATAEERRMMPIMNEDVTSFLHADDETGACQTSRDNSCVTWPASQSNGKDYATPSAHSNTSTDCYFLQIIDMGNLSDSDSDFLLRGKLFSMAMTPGTNHVVNRYRTLSSGPICCEAPE